MVEEKKYYIRKANGGWSPCILGNKEHRDKTLNVLPNCVGWATGRFNELANAGSCKYLGNTNAENFVNYVSKQKLELGQVPKVGACMVWQGKGSLAGHVAIVEEVISNSQVTTSESGWSASKSYWTQTRKKGLNNRWGLSSNYTFSGFIYNPNVIEYKISLPSRGYFKKGDRGKDVTLINEWLYSKYGNKKTLGNVFGNNTVSDVKKFQKEAKAKGTYTGSGATIDGNIGKLTLSAMRKDGFQY